MQLDPLLHSSRTRHKDKPKPAGGEIAARAVGDAESPASARLLKELDDENRQEEQEEEDSMFSLAAAKNLVSITMENRWQRDRPTGVLHRLTGRRNRLVSAASHFGDNEEDSPIDRQSVQHQSEPPWNIICCQGKTVRDLEEYIRATPSAIRTDSGFARDAAGATVLHIAVLNSRLDMVKYLMDTYGAELIKLVSAAGCLLRSLGVLQTGDEAGLTLWVHGVRGPGLRLMG